MKRNGDNTISQKIVPKYFMPKSALSVTPTGHNSARELMPQRRSSEILKSDEHEAFYSKVVETKKPPEK
jgi:hypothetical protein